MNEQYTSFTSSHLQSLTIRCIRFCATHNSGQSCALKWTVVIWRGAWIVDVKSLSLLFLHSSHWNLCVSHSRFFSLSPTQGSFSFLFCSDPSHFIDRREATGWTLWVKLLSIPQMTSVLVDTIHPSFLPICDIRANFKKTTGRLGSTWRKSVFCSGKTSECCWTHLFEGFQKSTCQ